MKDNNFLSDLFNRVINFNSWFLVGIVSIFTFLRLPSLFEPYWYGDEGIYEVIGTALRHGELLYKDIWDNKPPFLYLIYALFDGNQMYVKLASLIAGVAALVAFYFLARKVFSNRFSYYAATTVFGLLFGLPFLEGNIANAENFMLFPIVLSAYVLYVHFPKRTDLWKYALIGVLMSIALLIKIVAVFDCAAFVCFMLAIAQKKPNLALRHTKTIILVMIVSFCVLPVLTFLYFTGRGAGFDLLKAVFSQNVGYVGFNNYFIFPLGLVLLKVLFLMITIAVIFVFRKRLPSSALFIYFWLSFAMFSAFFSERPYTHYLLVVLPSFSLLIGILFEKRLLRIINLPIFMIIIFLAFTNFTLYFKNGAYYQNYIAYTFGNKSEQDYQSFFDPNTPRLYALSDFVRTHTTPNDSVFFWTDSGQIYVLSGKLPPGKYVVAYHMTFYPDGFANARSAIVSHKPKYIIDLKDDPEMIGLTKGYSLKFVMDNSRIYEREN